MPPIAKIATLLCLVIAVLSGGQGLFIKSKAVIAQVLLNAAWSKSVVTQSPVRAWPWADTYPVARLSVPSLEKDFVVLEGVSGEAMAFGPGRIPGSSRHSAHGVFAIGGHRDTHLSFLETVEDNTPLILQTIDGEEQIYHITEQFVADSRTDSLQLDSDQHGLVLITCYPFHATQTGGPLRYVVIASPLARI